MAVAACPSNPTKMDEQVRVFPVTTRRRKSRSPTPSKSIAKLFPNGRSSCKTPVDDRNDQSYAKERPNAIPKLKLRSLAQHLLPDAPQTLRDFERKESIKTSLSSTASRGVLYTKNELLSYEVKLMRLQSLGELMQTFLAKPSDDGLLEVLRSADSTTHSAGSCSLCGCSCRGVLSSSIESASKLATVRQINKQTTMVDVTETSLIRECQICKCKYCDDAESSELICSLCNESSRLAKQESLTLRLQLQLGKTMADSQSKRRDVSPRVFRLRASSEFPPRFSTPTKTLPPVSPSCIKQDSSDYSALHVSLAGKTFTINLNERQHNLHVVLPLSEPLSNYAQPPDNYVSAVDMQRNPDLLSTKGEQTRLITPKFRGPPSATESTNYTDKSQSNVLRQVTDRLEMIEAEADKASERLRKCLTSISAELEQFAVETIMRDAEKSLESVLKATGPILDKLSCVSPRLNDCVLMAFGLILMVTDRLLVFAPSGRKNRSEVDKLLEDTRKKMQGLQASLQECQESYEERLLQLLLI